MRARLPSVPITGQTGAPRVGGPWAGGGGSSGLGRGSSRERERRRVHARVRASPHARPPPLSCSTGAHLIPVGPRTRPTIPSPHLVPWRRSGRGGGSRHKGKASRSKAKGKSKASLTKVKMSSSASVEVAPGSVDHYGEHGGPAGTSPVTVGGVIPGVALPAAGPGDARLKVVLTLKLSLRKTSRVPRQAHGVQADTLARNRRPHRPRNATEADTGLPGP